MGDLIRCNSCDIESGVCEMLFTRASDEVDQIADIGSTTTPDGLRDRFDALRQQAGLPNALGVDSELSMTLFAGARNRKVEQLTQRLRGIGCTLSDVEINLNLSNSKG